MILIPAYEPDHTLIGLVDELLEILRKKNKNLHRDDGVKITIVNDGSQSEVSKEVFCELALKDVVVLNHEKNLGKGAALKSGIEYAKKSGAAFIVTADADGQHLPMDVIRVLDDGLSKATKVVMGGREFDSNTPTRSRVGNYVTTKLFHWMHSNKIDDTQTGLRFIPKAFFDRLMDLPMNKYDFELAALILFAKEDVLSEIKINTIYEPGNPSSHFRKMRDSAKIYFVLFRGALTSGAVSVVDYLTFLFVSMFLDSTVLTVLSARFVSAILSFYLARDFVFRSKAKRLSHFSKFFALVMANIFLVAYLVDIVISEFNLSKFSAYILLTAPIFFINFYIQKRWIFNSRSSAA